jgi:hypothetical protein
VSRRHKRGFNGRIRRPRRTKPTPIEAAPVVIPIPTRTLTGPRTEREPEKHAGMLALIERTREQLDERDQREWARARKYDNEPMIGEPVWHPHNVNERQ